MIFSSTFPGIDVKLTCWFIFLFLNIEVDLLASLHRVSRSLGKIGGQIEMHGEDVGGKSSRTGKGRQWMFPGEGK